MVNTLYKVPFAGGTSLQENGCTAPGPIKHHHTLQNDVMLYYHGRKAEDWNTLLIDRADKGMNGASTRLPVRPYQPYPPTLLNINVQQSTPALFHNDCESPPLPITPPSRCSSL